MGNVTKQVVQVYVGRNYPTEVVVMQNSTPFDFIAAGVTKVGVLINGVEYFSTDGYITYDSTGKVTFKLGNAPNLTKGKFSSRLFYYNAENPQGRPIYTEKTPFRLMFEFL